MSERKVLNKYYPPDFDPNAIPRRRMPKNRSFVVRLMAPFNMRCMTCGEYIYKGKKFNAMKEDVLDERYLGLRIYRFYIRCPTCTTEISFRTDPKNTDYICEQGATRNLECWRASADRAQEMRDYEAAHEEADDDEANPMAALERRTKESKQEMDILDALEDIKDANSRNFSVSVDNLIAQKIEAQKEAQRRLDEEDDRLAKQLFSNFVRRVADDGDEEDDEGSKNGNPDSTPNSSNYSRTSSNAGSLAQGSDPVRGEEEGLSVGEAHFDDEDDELTKNAALYFPATGSDPQSSTLLGLKRDRDEPSSNSKAPKPPQVWERSVGTLGKGTPLIKNALVKPKKAKVEEKAPKPSPLGLVADYSDED